MARWAGDQNDVKRRLKCVKLFLVGEQEQGVYLRIAERALVPRIDLQSFVELLIIRRNALDKR